MFEGSSLFTAGVCLVSFMKNVFSVVIYINTKQESNLNSFFHSQELNSGKIYLQNYGSRNILVAKGVCLSVFQ